MSKIRNPRGSGLWTRCATALEKSDFACATTCGRLVRSVVIRSRTSGGAPSRCTPTNSIRNMCGSSLAFLLMTWELGRCQLKSIRLDNAGASDHVIETKTLKFKELEHVLIEKAEQLFRDMLCFKSDISGRRAGPRHRFRAENARPGRPRISRSRSRNRPRSRD